MSSERITTRQQGEELLVRKAAEDAAFRQQLVTDPKGTIFRELGVKFQDDVQIQVVEESDKQLYLVLPPAAPAKTDQLSEAELSAVVGGIIIIGGMPSAEKARPTISATEFNAATPGM